jgi:hypothetical protein
MQSKFQMGSDTSSEQPSRFFTDMQQLFGDDPDPLFLEESWTLGIPAAVENLHRRRQDLAEREHQSRAFRELGSVGTLSFVEDREQAVESLLADRAANIASRYDASWSQRAPQVSAAPSWKPQDWTPEDRSLQSYIPEGWMPAGIPPRPEALQEAADPLCELPMSEAHARQLLGVTAESTREQVRSAYRRMVGQWHPDRLQHASEDACRQATRQMAALNEAYRMLCEALLEEAA